MRRTRIVGSPILVFGTLFIAVMGLLTTALWNALLPHIFGLPAITFWQALGLLLLSRVLFGGLGGWGHRIRKARFARGWHSLTAEERERFRQATGVAPASRPVDS